MNEKINNIYCVVAQIATKSCLFFSVMAVVWLIVAISATLQSCTGRVEGATESVGRTVVVSVPPLRYFAERIGGDSVDVQVLLPAGTDAETFEPGISAMRGLSSAKVFFSTGLMPFERKMADNLSADRTARVNICDVSRGIEYIYGTHAHGAHSHSGHSHGSATVHSNDDGTAGEADPHIWSSVENARIIASNILAGLVETDSANAKYYRTNYDRLLARIDAVADTIASYGIPSATAFAISHPSLSYFARDMQLEQLAVGSEHKESSAKGMGETLSHIRTHKPAVLFVEKGTDARQAAMLGNALGLQPVEINPMNPLWDEELLKIARQFSSNR